MIKNSESRPGIVDFRSGIDLKYQQIIKIVPDFPFLIAIIFKLKY